MKHNILVVLESLYLVLIPVIYSYFAGFAMIKFTKSKYIIETKELFIPFLGFSICVALQLIILKLQLIPYAQKIYFGCFFVFLIYILPNLLSDLTYRKKILINILLCTITTFFVFFTQRLTIGYGIVPLQYISESGF